MYDPRTVTDHHGRIQPYGPRAEERGRRMGVHALPETERRWRVQPDADRDAMRRQGLEFEGEFRRTFEGRFAVNDGGDAPRYERIMRRQSPPRREEPPPKKFAPSLASERVVSVADDFICVICTELPPLSDVVSSRCGHLFCERCASRWAAQSDKCPSCNSVPFAPEALAPLPLRLLKKVMVRCATCVWEGHYLDLETHEGTHPPAKEEEEKKEVDS